jgi:hypothetical protein
MVTLDTRDIGTPADGPTTRRYVPEDLAWASDLLERSCGRLRIRRGAMIDAAVLPGVVSLESGVRNGLLTVMGHNEELEIVAIAGEAGDPDLPLRLIQSAIAGARPDCRRVWTVCHNAEFSTQRMLQQCGFRLSASRPGAWAATSGRLANGRLPDTIDGVPIRDELEYDLILR